MSTTSFKAKEAVEGTDLAAFSEGSKKIPANVTVDASGNDAVGSPATGVSPEAGATGQLGWLSSIYSKLASTLNIRPLTSATDSVNVGNFPTTQEVNASSLPLPDGASTEATLLGVKTALESGITVDNFPATQSISGSVNVGNFPTTQAVSAASLPLPTGASTEVTLLGVKNALESGITVANIASTSQTNANENKYFSGPINPTIGTGVALTIATRTVFLATQPSITINAPTKAVTLDKIMLMPRVAGTGLTALQLVVIVDTVNRYTSGGTVVSLRSSINNTLSTAIARTGQVTIVATNTTATERRVYNGVIKSAIPAINDNYTLYFGNDNIVETGLTNSTRQGLSLPPVIIPVGGTALIYLFGAGMTAAPAFEGTIHTIE
jgi:hypothetical protein